MKISKDELETIQDLASTVYSDRDYDSHHSDLAKENKECIISYDYSYVKQMLEDAYLKGFEDGYLEAKESPKGEWGEYLIEN